MKAEDFARLEFGVSIFHAYAHEFSCQVLYSPRTMSGAGLTNGEGCERVWSKLR